MEPRPGSLYVEGLNASHACHHSSSTASLPCTVQRSGGLGGPHRAESSYGGPAWFGPRAARYLRSRTASTPVPVHSGKRSSEFLQYMTKHSRLRFSSGETWLGLQGVVLMGEWRFDWQVSSPIVCLTWPGERPQTQATPTEGHK
ncbi:hypothetical protein SKAU_G00044020 [Synaphobranchus kaupii]|uniref:Uncharacterized protein n=1 Tax=Synaphobranchus kaupii TaxID=118154 RepID=A0A9Q1G1Q4_SYNKA|nr:hypothetical protein SKAU_G00044020 [Synaphobranchus kaupii]